MKLDVTAWIAIIFTGLLIGVGVIFFTGTAGILYTKYIKTEQRNVEREVFENSESYVRGKRTEALKLFREYTLETDSITMIQIKNVVSMNFSDFDAELLQDQILINFVNECKYKYN